jgi:ubiquinone biosynthesis protein
MLSTRPDLVGEDVAAELTHLQSHAPPDPPGVAEATIQKELGSPPSTLFASFDPTPFASASIAQVHYARLHSGESVVVKIQKDGIESRIDADLAMLAYLAALAAGISVFGAVGYVAACFLGVNLSRDIRSSERRPRKDS